ncbi:MAG: hypothetical protein SGPRY_004730, partial [Prymnesium sp.]
MSGGFASASRIRWRVRLSRWRDGSQLKCPNSPGWRATREVGERHISRTSAVGECHRLRCVSVKCHKPSDVRSSSGTPEDSDSAERTPEDADRADWPVRRGQAIREEMSSPEASRAKRKPRIAPLRGYTAIRPFYSVSFGFIRFHSVSYSFICPPMTRRLSRPLPSTEPPQLWLRHPFVALCSGAELSLHTLQDRALDDSSLLTHHSHCTLPAAYCQPRAGLGGNALHGFDIRAGWLAGGTTTGSILLIPLHPEGALQREAMRVLEGHAKVVSWLCIHTSGERLYSSSFDRTIREWSLSDMTCLQTVKIGSPVLQLKLFPPSGGDDAQLLVGCGDGTIKLWDPQQRKAQKAIRTLRFTHRECVPPRPILSSSHAFSSTV